jgi:hypothetical protein
MNLVMLPMWISPACFSRRPFPGNVPALRARAAHAVIDALRAQMLQGVGCRNGPQLAVISGWLIVCFFTALTLFRWR